MLELAAEAKRRLTCKFVRFFPDSGPFSRDHYSKQIEFFAAGARFKERLLMAASERQAVARVSDDKILSRGGW